MKEIFPKEFLAYTSEVHRYRHRRKSVVIYAILLLSILGFLLALPLIRIPIYISSPGTITGEVTSDSLFLAECHIRAGDIALIRKHMPVTYQIDAYDHNQWGLATGNIIHVSRNAELDQDQAIFKIRCSMNQTYLSLRNGQRGFLIKGQTLTAHIPLNERSLFDLLSDQWDDWLDPKVRN